MATKPSVKVSYNTSDNHLSTSVSEFLEYVSWNRSTSDASTGGGNQYGAYKDYGNTNTGYIPNYISLSNEDKKKVIYERNNLGVKLGGGKGSKNGNELDKLRELKNKKSMFKRSIRALKKNITNGNDEGDDNDKPEDAGDQFGGNQYKNKSKQN